MAAETMHTQVVALPDLRAFVESPAQEQPLLWYWTVQKHVHRSSPGQENLTQKVAIGYS